MDTGKASGRRREAAPCTSQAPGVLLLSGDFCLPLRTCPTGLPSPCRLPPSTSSSHPLQVFHFPFSIPQFVPFLAPSSCLPPQFEARQTPLCALPVLCSLHRAALPAPARLRRGSPSGLRGIAPRLPARTPAPPPRGRTRLPAAGGCCEQEVALFLLLLSRSGRRARVRAGRAPPPAPLHPRRPSPARPGLAFRSAAAAGPGGDFLTPVFLRFLFVCCFPRRPRAALGLRAGPERCSQPPPGPLATWAGTRPGAQMSARQKEPEFEPPPGGEEPGPEPQPGVSSEEEFDFSTLFEYDYLKPIEGLWPVSLHQAPSSSARGQAVASGRGAAMGSRVPGGLRLLPPLVRCPSP